MGRPNRTPYPTQPVGHLPSVPNPPTFWDTCPAALRHKKTKMCSLKIQGGCSHLGYILSVSYWCWSSPLQPHQNTCKPLAGVRTQPHPSSAILCCCLSKCWLQDRVILGFSHQICFSSLHVLDSNLGALWHLGTKILPCWTESTEKQEQNALQTEK